MELVATTYVVVVHCKKKTEIFSLIEEGFIKIQYNHVKLVIFKLQKSKIWDTGGINQMCQKLIGFKINRNVFYIPAANGSFYFRNVSVNLEKALFSKVFT